MASTYRNIEAPVEPYQWQEKSGSGTGRRKWIVRILSHSATRLQPKPPTSIIDLGVGHCSPRYYWDRHWRRRCRLP